MLVIRLRRLAVHRRRHRRLRLYSHVGPPREHLQLTAELAKLLEIESAAAVLIETLECRLILGGWRLSTERMLSFEEANDATHLLEAQRAIIVHVELGEELPDLFIADEVLNLQASLQLSIGVHDLLKRIRVIGRRGEATGR